MDTVPLSSRILPTKPPALFCVRVEMVPPTPILLSDPCAMRPIRPSYSLVAVPVSVMDKPETLCPKPLRLLLNPEELLAPATGAVV